jgi:hypothetical protein
MNYVSLTFLCVSLDVLWFKCRILQRHKRGDPGNLVSRKNNSAIQCSLEALSITRLLKTYAASIEVQFMKIWNSKTVIVLNILMSRQYVMNCCNRTFEVGMATYYKDIYCCSVMIPVWSFTILHNLQFFKRLFTDKKCEIQFIDTFINYVIQTAILIGTADI